MNVHRDVITLTDVEISGRSRAGVDLNGASQAWLSGPNQFRTRAAAPIQPAPPSALTETPNYSSAAAPLQKSPERNPFRQDGLVLD
jgi:hypothetical protein